MSFANKNLKNKIKKIVNLISVTIVSFIALLLLFYNIKGFYYSHKIYKTNIENNNDIKEYTEEISNNINLIENNQGTYTEEEYKLILEFVNDIKVLINKDIEKELLNKNKLTIKDFNKFFSNISIYDIYGYDGLNNYRGIYKIILKYNIDKYDNMYQYYLAQRYYLNIFEELHEIYYPIYKYDYSPVEYIEYENYIRLIFELKYISYKIILSDIVEVGGLSE